MKTVILSSNSRADMDQVFMNREWDHSVMPDIEIGDLVIIKLNGEGLRKEGYKHSWDLNQPILAARARSDSFKVEKTSWPSTGITGKKFDCRVKLTDLLDTTLDFLGKNPNEGKRMSPCGIMYVA